ncbi:MAG: ABC transporter substrate-binding protein, partial [Rhodococcus sp. (in: high G+C Gram-positive bacteria)]
VLVTLFGTTGSNPNRRTVPERIDELLDRLGRTTDPAARQSITTAAAGEVIDQGHGIPLFEQSTIIATSPGTQGVVLDASSRPNFYGTRIDR